MLQIEKYAAIDIGSNAIRLLIATILEKEGFDTQFKKTSLVRVPIRLGADVFLEDKISEVNYLRMKDAMNAFSLIMKTHKVKHYKACATSAMREAKNGAEIAARLKKETGISIQIIDGKKEAAYISTTDLHDLVKENDVFLYVDVGGGSTEFTVFAEGQRVTSKSFPLGTVRILNDMIREQLWEEVKIWIKENTSMYSKVQVIGSGGNINSIFKASGTKMGKPLSYFFLVNYYEKLKSLTYHERIFDLQMNPDRADVIIPATRIYLSAMKWSKAKNIFVPKVGLADGMVRSMYLKNKAKLEKKE
ncbi:MAG: exopolyphosphatase [Flavobacteriaceae bacterium]|nr:exopolyphosphatase [Flavobacteriaceae bacterium]